MESADEEDFRSFVSARLEQLRRTAYLVCRDWHGADDLVSITIGKLYRHWRQAKAAENIDAYVRGMLVNAWLDERRRPWRREALMRELPETADGGGEANSDQLAQRTSLLQLLAQLPARRRAVVVLRYYCDLSARETAQILGVTEGTVKSQAARGLEALRLMTEEAHNGQEQ